MGRTALLSAALLIVASCGESPTRPTPVTGSADSPKAEISVHGVTPGSGATLIFRDCGKSRLSLCTDQLQTTFDVLVMADIPNAAVLVSLQQGSLPCAWAYLPMALTAGNRTSISTSSLDMVYDEEGRLLCAMPTETTTLVFQVFYENSPARPVLARELLYRYTLATQ